MLRRKKEKKKKSKNANKQSEDKQNVAEADNTSKISQTKPPAENKSQDDMLNSYVIKIEEFINNPNQDSFELPPDLNSYERMKIHEYAEQTKLIHESIGEGNERHIVLKKSGQEN